ncbi:glycosyltransferase family 2 protein [Candidatus Pelagibacter sp.]|nr:glycosyltransferase family 2 protein [Candidatus Pelagibacter sp.]
MKKNFVSILITNYNKSRYLKKTISSCLNQNFDNKEILVFDDCSTDNSLKILNKFKKIKVIRNKKKKFKSGPLNQIYGLNELFKISKGNIIFLLDSDDMFRKNKLFEISKIFKKNKKINFIQDTPLINLFKKKMLLKKKKHFFSIWPSFFPTSCITFERSFFQNFLKVLRKNEFPNLEIDARLSIYAHIRKQFFLTKKCLTIYNYDENGISSKYKKFSKNWWKKRDEAFSYMIFLMKKFDIKLFLGPDFYLTKIINFFI